MRYMYIVGKKKLYRKLGLNFALGRFKAIIRQYFRIDLGATQKINLEI